MIRQARFVIVALILSVLIFSLLVSCANPAPTPIATQPAPTTFQPAPTATPPAPTEALPVASELIRPGDVLGEMVVDTAKDQTGEPSVIGSCSPIITPNDPPVIVRTCSLPQLPYLFIGYGEFDDSLEKLNSIWNNEAWEMYFDGKPVDLTAFGSFDVDWAGNKLRQWNVAVKNATPGEHKLRFIIRTVDRSHPPTDVTWIFTLEASQSPATPAASSNETGAYPTLSAIPTAGQARYTSEKAKLDFLLYLPGEYGKDPQQKWPLILYLHGLGERGHNLDYLLIGGLPKTLHNKTDFPFLVVSPQGNGEYEFWSKDAMISSLFRLLDEIQARYSVDPQRIYLTGVSAGGEGTWEIGLRYPHRFAALVPVMGYYGYPFHIPKNVCDLKAVPIWAFHGAKDELVPLDAEQGLVDTLRTCGGKAQLTLFPDKGHDIENEVYANPELYTWMLAQSLK